MKFPDAVEKAIETRNYKNVYSYFYTVLLSDPYFSSGRFSVALNEIKQRNLPGFFQEYNQVPFLSKEQWTDEYWDSLSSELMDNFCFERIDMIQKVGTELAQKKSQESPSSIPLEKAQTPSPQKPGGSSTRVLIVGGVIVILLLVIILVLFLR